MGHESLEFPVGSLVTIGGRNSRTGEWKVIDWDDENCYHNSTEVWCTLELVGHPGQTTARWQGDLKAVVSAQ